MSDDSDQPVKLKRAAVERSATEIVRVAMRAGTISSALSAGTIAHLNSKLRASDIARTATSLSSIAAAAKAGSAFANIADFRAIARAGAAAASISNFGSIAKAVNSFSTISNLSALANAGAAAKRLSNLSAIANAGSAASIANFGAIAKASADATALARNFSGVIAATESARRSLHSTRAMATMRPIHVGLLSAAIKNAGQVQQARQLYAMSLPKLPAFDYSALNRIAVQQQQLRASISSVASVHQNLARQLTDLRGLTSRLDEFAALAKTLDKSHLLARFAEQPLPDLERLKELEQKADENNTRDILFAIWDGDEVMPPEGIIKDELEADFDSLSVNAKLDRLLQLAEANPTPRTVEYLVAIALNCVANSLGQQFSYVMWALISTVIFAGYFWPKDRLRSTRKIMRASNAADPNSRLVRTECRIFKTPKSKSMQIGWLDAAAIVIVADSFKGWRQVYFLDVESDEARLGWVRSKYLARI